MTLYGEEDDLAWTVFCNLPEGVVSGSVDARTGVFTPSLAPPAIPPSVATVAVPATPGPQSSVTSTSSASCVALFSPETLRDRAFVFDGTVVSLESRIDPRLPEEGSPWVTFRVNRWFKGGDTPNVAIWVEPQTPGGVSALEPGDRILVAGEYRWGQPPEDPLAWGCGFTRPHTPEAAADWADAIGE
jgi:hypothetical protein